MECRSACQDKISLTFLQALGIGLLCLIILLRTLAPTIYSLDSAELAIGAARLGIVHAPGYALYLMLAHVLTHLPVGDVAYRVNLFSAVCLALTAPLLFGLLNTLLADRIVAAFGALTFVWSRYVWQSGVVAEIYAFQLLTLAAAGWALARLYRQTTPVSTRQVALVGLLTGLAMAAAPASILFVPGLVVAFRGLRIPWKKSLWAAFVSLCAFGLPQVYFPLRAHAAFDIFGTYDASGLFHPENLRSVGGMARLLLGSQFDNLFFYHGWCPVDTAVETAGWFWANYLGLGVFLGLAGLFAMRRGLAAVWLVLFVPYTYFFITYGAADRDTMFGPSYLLWSVVLAYGARWFTEALSPLPKTAILLGGALLLLVINYPLLNLSQDRNVRDYGETLMDGLPPDALVFGEWWEIQPLEFLHIVEGRRPDVTLYNLFLFDDADLDAYVASRFAPDSAPRPIIVLSSARDRLERLEPTGYTYVALGLNGAIRASTAGNIEAFRVEPAPQSWRGE